MRNIEEERGWGMEGRDEKGNYCKYHMYMYAVYFIYLFNYHCDGAILLLLLL